MPHQISDDKFDWLNSEESYNYILLFSFSNPNFQTMAAITAPMMGATKNSQSCESALPPEKIAGPRLLAGFTEVPVTGIATRWISIRVTPIANPAMAP